MLTKNDSTTFYINNLNWSSFGITYTYVSSFYLGKDAKKIISINDSTKEKKLLRAIDDENKTVAIHMILTQILEPNHIGFGYVYHYLGNNIDYTTYTFNGLSWQERFGQNQSTYIVTNDQIESIKNYWVMKLR